MSSEPTRARSPDRSGSSLARAWRLGDQLSIWQTLYVLGLGTMFAQATTGRAWAAPGATLTLALSAHALFLLDRVKLRRADLDPADAAADPERHGLLRRLGAPLRALIGVELIAAVVIGVATLSWSVGALIGMGVVCVVLYSERPAGSGGIGRLKDIPVLKNLCVALGLVALAMVVEVPATGWLSLQFWEVALAGVLIVLGDAILCDLDDVESDRAFGVRTLPVILGRKPAIVIALACISGAAAALLLPGHASAWWIRAFWSVGAPASAAVALIWRPRNVKALIDVRLLLLAIAVGAIAPWR